MTAESEDEDTLVPFIAELYFKSKKVEMQAAEAKRKGLNATSVCLEDLYTDYTQLASSLREEIPVKTDAPDDNQ